MSQLWDEEEELTELPMMGVELFFVEDLEITMEGIFGEFHSEK